MVLSLVISSQIVMIDNTIFGDSIYITQDSHQKVELISRIELETSPLPRECSTAELYEQFIVIIYFITDRL